MFCSRSASATSDRDRVGIAGICYPRSKCCGSVQQCHRSHATNGGHRHGGSAQSQGKEVPRCKVPGLPGLATVPEEDTGHHVLPVNGKQLKARVVPFILFWHWVFDREQTLKGPKAAEAHCWRKD